MNVVNEKSYSNTKSVSISFFSDSIITRAGRLQVLKCCWLFNFFICRPCPTFDWFAASWHVLCCLRHCLMADSIEPIELGWEPKSRREKKNVCRNGVSRVNFSKYTQNGPSILGSASLVNIVKAHTSRSSVKRQCWRDSTPGMHNTKNSDRSNRKIQQKLFTSDSIRWKPRRRYHC